MGRQNNAVIPEAALHATLTSRPEWAPLVKTKEWPLLAEVLQPGEEIVEVGTGNYEGHLGLVAVTTGRVVFAGRKVGSLLKATKNETFDYSRIQSVDVAANLLAATLTVSGAGPLAVVSAMNPPVARRIADAIRSRLGRPSPPPVATAPPIAAPPVSVAGEIDRLAELHRSGALTDAEFTAAKAKLLG